MHRRSANAPAPRCAVAPAVPPPPAESRCPTHQRTIPAHHHGQLQGGHACRTGQLPADRQSHRRKATPPAPGRPASATALQPSAAHTSRHSVGCRSNRQLHSCPRANLPIHDAIVRHACCREAHLHTHGSLRQTPGSPHRTSPRTDTRASLRTRLQLARRRLRPPPRAAHRHGHRSSRGQPHPPTWGQLGRRPIPPKARPPRSRRSRNPPLLPVRTRARPLPRPHTPQCGAVARWLDMCAAPRPLLQWQCPHARKARPQRCAGQRTRHASPPSPSAPDRASAAPPPARPPRAQPRGGEVFRLSAWNRSARAPPPPAAPVPLPAHPHRNGHLGSRRRPRPHHRIHARGPSRRTAHIHPTHSLHFRSSGQARRSGLMRHSAPAPNLERHRGRRSRPDPCEPERRRGYTAGPAVASAPQARPGPRMPLRAACATR
eukprot:scaffold20035_cov112-Isochrysis_galbana.AAC.2